MKAQDIINYYYKFIDTMGLNERNPEFKITDIVDWFADVMKVDSSDKYVNMISVMFGKAWANEGLCNRYDDENFEAVMFEDDDYSEFGNDDVDFSYKGKHDVADLDDDYLRDYGNRGVRFSSIDSKFAEGKTIKKRFGKRIMKEAKSDNVNIKDFAKNFISTNFDLDYADKKEKEFGKYIEEKVIPEIFKEISKWKKDNKEDEFTDDELNEIIFDVVDDKLISLSYEYCWKLFEQYYWNDIKKISEFDNACIDLKSDLFTDIKRIIK